MTLPLPKAVAGALPPSTASLGVLTLKRGPGHGRSASTLLDQPTVVPPSSPGSGFSQQPIVSTETGRLSQSSPSKPYISPPAWGKRFLVEMNNLVGLLYVFGWREPVVRLFCF